MNPSQHAEQFQSQLANYVPQFTPEFWPVWLIIAGLLLVGMWLVLGLHALLRARGVKKSATDHGEKIYLYSKAVRLWHWSNALLFVLLLASGLINHLRWWAQLRLKVWLRCMKFADFCYWHAGLALF